MESVREQIKNYFKLSEEEKDELLVKIVESYVDVINRNKNSDINIMDFIEHDLEIFVNSDEFEAAQAITDIKNAIIKITDELYGL